MGREQGFTVLELMIAMGISIVAVGVIYASYSNQQRTFVRMRQIAEIQQNLRASMYLLEKGLKSARYDPTESGFARILRADTGEFHYEADVNGNMNDFNLVALNASPGVPNPDPNERVRFSLDDGRDVDKDGIPDDNRPCELVRETWNGGGLPMSDNIDALNFVYILDDDSVLDLLPRVDPADATPLNRIRRIEVTIVARSSRDDPRYVDRGMPDPANPANPRGYFNLQGERILDAPNDNFYRRALSRVIDCANMVNRP